MTRIANLPPFDETVDIGKTPAINSSGLLAWSDATAAQRAQWVGTGEDGAATITTSTATISDWITSGVLQRDVNLTDLTVSGAGAIACGGYRIFYTGTLDLTNAAAGAIHRDGNPGGNSASNVGGSAGTGLSSPLLAGSSAGLGGSGGNSTNALGGAVVTATTVSGGEVSGASGAGGNGSAGTGGTLGAPAAPSATQRVRLNAPTLLPVRGALAFTGAQAGSAGAGGGGNSALPGGGGGGAPSGAGIVIVSGRRLKTGPSTPAGVIRSRGGRGGNGFSAVNTNTGGGGGAGGANGAFVGVYFFEREGPPVTGLVQSAGGDGGTGGTGNGTGTSGGGGSGGSGARIIAANMTTGVMTIAGPVAGAAGSGTAGGAGGVSAITI